ncbi:MAG: hypothetical protein WCJ30_29030 [Deltaproteobacteria bacterium]
MTVDAVGTQIPAEVSQRYRATVPLYAGATGLLYEGTDPGSGRPVVVKVLRDAALPSTAERQRVLRELQKLVQVRHGALVSVLASGESQGRIWLVRERVQGQSVGELLAQRGPMPPGMVARVAAQVVGSVCPQRQSVDPPATSFPQPCASLLTNASAPSPAPSGGCRKAIRTLSHRRLRMIVLISADGEYDPAQAVVARSHVIPAAAQAVSQDAPDAPKTHFPKPPTEIHCPSVRLRASAPTRS